VLVKILFCWIYNIIMSLLQRFWYIIYHPILGAKDLLSEEIVYKVNEEKKEILPNMHQFFVSSSVIFMDGMFYLIGGNLR